MKKLLVICLATIVALCSCTGNGEKEYKKAEAAYQNDHYKKSVFWLKKAAKKGHVDAQCDLGVCYYEGNLVSRDYKQAVYWFKKAAEQGHTLAQRNLGVCYYKGYGVIQDYKKAKYWWEKAAARGDADAIFFLDELN